MADKLAVMFKRIPVIIGFIMILVGIVLVFALPIMLIPMLTETSADLKEDFDPGARKFASYHTKGDFTMSGTISNVTSESTLFLYEVDDSEFTLNSKSDLGDEGDFILVKVRVAQDKQTDDDYLLAIESSNQIIYNIPGFIIFVVGVSIFLFGLLRKTPDERASREKAIARKKALDKELDTLERELQTSMVGPPGGMPGMPGMQAPPPAGMPPAGMAARPPAGPGGPGVPPGQAQAPMAGAPGQPGAPQPGRPMPPGQPVPPGQPMQRPPGAPPGQPVAGRPPAGAPQPGQVRAPPPQQPGQPGQQPQQPQQTRPQPQQQ
jgi:hypothetical protein